MFGFIVAWWKLGQKHDRRNVTLSSWNTRKLIVLKWLHLLSFHSRVLQDWCSGGWTSLKCDSSVSIEQIWQLIIVHFVCKVSSTPGVTRFLWLSHYSCRVLCSYFMSSNIFRKCQPICEAQASTREVEAEENSCAESLNDGTNSGDALTAVSDKWSSTAACITKIDIQTTDQNPTHFIGSKSAILQNEHFNI